MSVLQALCDHYYRDPESVPYGTQKVLMSFILVLTPDGRLKDIEDLRDDGNRGMPAVVPAGVHSNGVSPLLLFDNVQYLLGYTTNTEPEKIQKTLNKHMAFIARCEDAAARTADPDLEAVAAFYRNDGVEAVHSHPLWETIRANPLSWLTFRIEGQDEPVTAMKVLYSLDTEAEGGEHVCLVTGLRGPTVRLCQPTPIKGSQVSGKLVSFNDKSSCSFGKSQGENAPISPQAEAAFSTALIKMTKLDTEHRYKYVTGNRTWLIWPSVADETAEEARKRLFAFLGAAGKDAETEGDGRNPLQALLEDIRLGRRPVSDNMFHFLCLTPNTGLAVIHWSQCTLKEFADKVLRHFADTEIHDASKSQRQYQGLYRMLASVSREKDLSDLSPRLYDDTLRSILEGGPYPAALQTACLNRIRTESHKGTKALTRTRAAILKGCLNRKHITKSPIKTMLDRQNNNPAYLCGRLFATLDFIQRKANNRDTIGTNFMALASTTPSAAFPTVLRLSNQYLKKLNAGQQVFFEKIKQEIIGQLPAEGFPGHLNSDGQSRFLVGYYQQLQDFYTAKADKEPDSDNENK